MRLTALTDEFLLDCRARRLSPRTIAWYEANLRYFREWLGEDGQDDDLRALTLSNARRYSHHLAERPARLATFVATGARRGVHALTTGSRPISPVSASGYLRTLKVFSRWLADEAQGYTPRDALAGLRLPKRPKTRKEPLTPSEMSTLLEGHDLKTRIGMRDFAILLTYLSTGLRATELVDLLLDDVHVEEGYLRVRSGKGAKTRVINLPPETARAILRYRQHHRQHTDDHHLFLTRSGTPLTYDTVKMVLAREKGRTGIARLHPHLLRHSFGVASLGSGMDLMTLKETLGHEDIRTTSIYLAMSEQQLVAQQRKSDPLANVRLPKGVRNKSRPGG